MATGQPTLQGASPWVLAMDINGEERRVIRLFLAASPDMDDYTAAVERLCAEHNEGRSTRNGRALGNAAHTPLLVPVDWFWILESLDPGKPHLLLSRLPVAQGDIFLGIIGNTLKAPSGVVAPGIRQAFEIAWNHWQRSVPGRHLLYRLDDPTIALDRQQQQQLDQLFNEGDELDLSSRLFSPLSDRRGIRRRFKSADDLQQQLRTDLQRVLPHPTPSSATSDTEQHTLATLQVEIFAASPGGNPILLELSQTTAKRFSAQLQNPVGNLCQLSFSGKDIGKRLIQAGLFMLTELIRPRQINGTESIPPGIRLVADTVDIPGNSEIPPANLQYRLNDLQHQPIMPGEFAISRALQKLLPESLRGRFGRIDEAAKTVQVWRFVATHRPPAHFRRLLGDLLGSLNPHNGAEIRALAQRPPASIEICYALLEELSTVLQKTPSRHRAPYYARWLLELERRLRETCARHTSEALSLPPALAALRQLAGLAPSQQELTITRETVDAVQMLCRADDLGVATALEQLLQQHRPALLGLLQSDEMPALRRRLAVRLEGIADRVLLDDLAAKRSPAETGELFQTLADMLPDSDIAAVTQLLRGGTLATPADDAETSAIRQRCELLIGIQIQGGEPNLPRPEVLWPLVAAPNVNLDVLGSISDQLSRGGAVESRKLFFDCARARVQDINQLLRSEEEFQRLRKLLQSLLRQDYFLEIGYFQRLETLLGDFLRRAGDWSVPTEPYQRVLGLLERARQQRGNPRTRLPPIQGLPLTVQQRLAGEWPYLELFVTHPDFRVARATREHINAHNVEHVLFPEINKTLLAGMLREQQLFHRPSAIIAALRHPNCDAEFARRQLPQLLGNPAYRETVRQLATSNTSNPGVRMVIQQALTQSINPLRR